MFGTVIPLGFLISVIHADKDLNEKDYVLSLVITVFLEGLFFTWISWSVFLCHFGHFLLSKLTKGEMVGFALILCVFKWRRVKAQIWQPQNTFSWRREKSLNTML